MLLNMSAVPARFEGVHGSVTVATEHGLEGSSVEGGVTLAPWTGAVVAR